MIIFREPPARKRTDVGAVVAVLRDNPNEWAIVRTYAKDKGKQRAAHTYASHINNGRFPGYKGCEAYACTEDDGVHVYARWIPDASA